MRQTPAVQVVVAFGSTQTFPQPPQFNGSEYFATSQPLAGLLSQSRKPGVHAATAHAPTLHVAAAFGSMHTLLQAPQLFTSVWLSTSQPLFVRPSQFWNPGSQVPS
jgi:hypothetical protein